jgi:hypothetical protein
MLSFLSLQTIFGVPRVEVYKQTEILVATAAKYGGVVFGGYVRDVIIPLNKLNRNLADVDFKDMDFWFKNQTDADAFIKASALRLGLHDTNDNPSGCYPVCRNQHIFDFKDVSNAFLIIDIMVTDFYPVCDFSVNLVSWNGETLVVHKPYDIISHVAREIISKDDQLRKTVKFYTIDEIHSNLKLVKPGRSEYTLDELISYLNSLKIMPLPEILLSDTERETYLTFIKESESKSYLLDQIVDQIRNNYYDTSRSFLWMAQKGSEYPKFNRISQFASQRLYRFKEKKLGGSTPRPNHGDF